MNVETPIKARRPAKSVVTALAQHVHAKVKEAHPVIPTPEDLNQAMEDCLDGLDLDDDGGDDI